MNEILEWSLPDQWVRQAARPGLEDWYRDEAPRCEHRPEPDPGTFALYDDRIYCGDCATWKLGDSLLTGALLSGRTCYSCMSAASTLIIARPEWRSPGYHVLLGACEQHRPRTARVFATGPTPA